MLRYAKILPLTLLLSGSCRAMETTKQLMAIHQETIVETPIDLTQTMDLKSAVELEQKKLAILEQEEQKIKAQKESQKQKTDSRIAALKTKIKDSQDAAKGADYLRQTLEAKLAQVVINEQKQLAELALKEQKERIALENSLAQEKKELEAKIAEAKAEKEKYTQKAHDCSETVAKAEAKPQSTRHWYFLWMK